MFFGPLDIESNTMGAAEWFNVILKEFTQAAEKENRLWK